MSARLVRLVCSRLASALQLCPKWTCNNVQKCFATLSKKGLQKTYLPGKSLDKFTETEIVDNSQTIIQQLNYFIDNLYKITVRGFGELNSPVYCTYKEWLLNKLSTHILYHEKQKYIPHEILDRINNFFSDSMVFNETFSHFLHFDIKPQNLIFEPESKKLYIVDFEFSRFGDVEHELYRAGKRSVGFITFIEYIWKPVLEEYLYTHHLIISEQKREVFSIYYYLSELTYQLKNSKKQEADLTLKKLKKRLSEIN